MTEQKFTATPTSQCLAGSITAGCFSTLIGHPLDTIKVHQQVTTTNKAASTLQVAKGITQNGKYMNRLFLAGIGPPMANQILMNSVMFTVFDQIKSKTQNVSNTCDKSSTSSIIFSLGAGLISGFATACLSTPTDYFKIQSQLGNTRNTSNVPALKMIRTVYSGHVANLAREGVFTMVYLGLYDILSHHVILQNLSDYDGRREDSSQSSLRARDVILLSSFTGACAWICNYPFDTIKSVMQGRTNANTYNNTMKSSSVMRKHHQHPQPLSMREAIQLIYNSGDPHGSSSERKKLWNGVKAFFRGVGPSTTRAMLVTSARMLAYEKTIQLLR